MISPAQILEWSPKDNLGPIALHPPHDSISCSYHPSPPLELHTIPTALNLRVTSRKTGCVTGHVAGRNSWLKFRWWHRLNDRRNDTISSSNWKNLCELSEAMSQKLPNHRGGKNLNIAINPVPILDLPTTVSRIMCWYLGRYQEFTVPKVRKRNSLWGLNIRWLQMETPAFA